MFKKISVLVTIMVFAVAAQSMAHCGSCGVGDSHGNKEVKMDKKAKMDIIETAVGNKSFSTLVTAIKAAGLVDALKGEGPFTVFAPTDEAFAKLPKGTVEGLLNDKEALTAVLTYHVVPGKVTSGEVVKVKNASTLNGQDVTVSVKDKTVMIDNAKVIMTDIECSNGIIHVIDSVILPEMN